MAEPDVEAVPEDERVAVHQVRLDGLLVQAALGRVRSEYDDDVGFLTRLERGQYPQALRLGLGAALRTFRQADPDVDAGVAQGQRVGVALAAEAEHGHVAALDHRQVGVVVVEHFSCHLELVSLSSS